MISRTAKTIATSVIMAMAGPTTAAERIASPFCYPTQQAAIPLLDNRAPGADGQRFALTDDATIMGVRPLYIKRLSNGYAYGLPAPYEAYKARFLAAHADGKCEVNKCDKLFWTANKGQLVGVLLWNPEVRSDLAGPELQCLYATTDS